MLGRRSSSKNVSATSLISMIGGGCILHVKDVNVSLKLIPFIIHSMTILAVNAALSPVHFSKRAISVFYFTDFGLSREIFGPKMLLDHKKIN